MGSALLQFEMSLRPKVCWEWKVLQRDCAIWSLRSTDPRDTEGTKIRRAAALGEVIFTEKCEQKIARSTHR